MPSQEFGEQGLQATACATEEILSSSDLTHHYFFSVDREVGVKDEFLGLQWSCLPELRGQEETDGAQELQLVLTDADNRQEAIHDVHGEGKDFLLALLFLTHLKRRPDKNSLSSRFQAHVIHGM